ncbi:hypothetical protein [Brevibacillus choshinensis]|uniref:Secreted protein n=1 Tax=Brevibacillus choshinensis TaxID=54911 RepID=A0ABX7FWC5_BRECH|nr:hypothetical protein [Brevibacillus choshinensis]QRG70047.1 hypothetical protein JNE38_13545 [Brevibacillus choshinensis]
MVKTAVGALLYIAVVIGGFTIYDNYVAEDQLVVAGEMHSEDGNHGVSNEGSHGNGTEEHGEGDHGTGNQGHGAASSDVNTYVQPEQDGIKIFVKDKLGNPVGDLEVNHEKLLHFIVVDEHLQKYYHVHPEQIGKGEFKIGNILPDGFYKAFIDIKPKQLAYQVVPVPFVVGNPGESADHGGLVPDSKLIQTVEGETVKLDMSSFQANKPVTLTFELDRSNLTPYLGAMGHVVILDEKAQNFLHVHPSDHDEPVFETQFSKPGLYKIWAEFKQNGKVRAFPFVVEITED